MKADVFENPGRVVIFDENNVEYEYAGVKSDTALREAGDKKEVILKKVSEGDKVYLLEGTGNEYTRVFTEDGVTGYIKTSELDNIEKKEYSFDREKDSYRKYGNRNKGDCRKGEESSREGEGYIRIYGVGRIPRRSVPKFEADVFYHSHSQG